MLSQRTKKVLRINLETPARRRYRQAENYGKLEQHPMMADHMSEIRRSSIMFEKWEGRTDTSSPHSS
jgi:hypothetical protein